MGNAALCINVTPTRPLEKRVWARVADTPMHPDMAQALAEVDFVYRKMRPDFDILPLHRQIRRLDEWFEQWDRGADWQLEEFVERQDRIRSRYY